MLLHPILPHLNIRSPPETSERWAALAQAIKAALQNELRQYGYEVINALVVDLQPVVHNFFYKILSSYLGMLGCGPRREPGTPAPVTAR